MPLPRRTSSNTTHVSDSEPEREAYRRDNPETSSPPDSPSPRRTPLSLISNTCVNTRPIREPAVETRLSRLEGEIAELKHDLRVLTSSKRSRPMESPPSTPLSKRRRSVYDGATPETPILRSSLMATTPERDELARCVSENIRQCQCRNLLSQRAPVAPRAPGTRGQLRRRVHDLM
ncbi:hypothetical protein B0H17DRAFT_1214884 [Mycena rosella]|uniref:Uncharacterized protein n=1 Tax=Mycena rosella TaxID=1033263 RepID=A0AAD7G3G7_MYCRO|nr:hypothetical protein B0H17DRAFT_1214884 [Mycena rosella]